MILMGFYLLFIIEWELSRTGLDGLSAGSAKGRVKQCFTRPFCCARRVGKLLPLSDRKKMAGLEISSPVFSGWEWLRFAIRLKLESGSADSTPCC